MLLGTKPMPVETIIQQSNPPRPGRVSRKLNIRADVTLSAPRIGRLEPDDMVDVEASVQGESFQGQNVWYRLRGGDRFVRGGGVALGSIQPPPQPAAAEPVVQTRPDGTIEPFSVPQIGQVFGTFMSKLAKKPGSIDPSSMRTASRGAGISLPQRMACTLSWHGPTYEKETQDCALHRRRRIPSVRIPTDW